MCLLPGHAQSEAAIGELLFFSSSKKGVWKELGMESQWKQFPIWFGKHPLHFDPTINVSWRCCICFSCHGWRFVRRGLKGSWEGSTNSQHKERYSQPVVLNMQGTVQAHHRRSCDIMVPAFLGYWLVWWCLNNLSRTCPSSMQKKIRQIKVVDFQFCYSSSH